jgi:hypothetical protein
VKRVHYALGVAGLAPAAAGLLAPTAHAATDAGAHALRPTGKTVSLRHIGAPANVRSAHPASTSSVSSGLPSGSVIANFCSARTRTAKHNSKFGIQYYYTPDGHSTCIGTVSGWHAGGGLWKMMISVEADGAKAIYKCGTHHFSCILHINSDFPNFSRVCEAWYAGGTFKGRICRSPIPGGSFG